MPRSRSFLEYPGAFGLAPFCLLCACSSAPASHADEPGTLRTSSAAVVGAISAVTRQYNANRTGANLQETVLTPAVVGGSTFHKLFELSAGVVADEGKVEAQPLVAANVVTATGTRDLAIVCTMMNAVFAYDANDGQLVWQRVLGTPVDSADMDMWGINKKWGVSSTPVIDLETGTLYVVSFDQIGTGNRQHTLHALSLATGAQLSSIVVQGSAGGRVFSNGTTQPWQKLRAGLSIVADASGKKAVVLAFSMNGENVNGPGNGFVFAYDTRGLLPDATGYRTPAIWTPTPHGGSGGIWMAGGAPAIEGNFIYFTTGNGKSLQGTDLAESFIKLAYTAPASSAVAPSLALADYWTVFNDLARTTTNGGQDQDLGSAGVVVVPDTKTLFGGGKDGVLYDVDRTAMGKWAHMMDVNDWTGVNLPANAAAPFVATYLASTCVNASVNLDCNLPQNTPDGMTHHIHGTPVFWDHGDNTAAVYVWGENEVVKGYNYDKLASRLTGWFANGTVAASIGTSAAPTIAKPGGMPGGMLTLSANAGTDGIVWGTFPIKGDANRTVLAGGLAAFDATTLALLWRSDQSTNGGVDNAVGSMSKFAPPLVVNGMVYVSTYSNKVNVYGVAGAGVGTPATTYATMYLRGTFNNSLKQAGMGRLATNTWTQTITIKATTDCFRFDVLGNGATSFGGVNAATGTAVQGAATDICPNVLPGEYTITFDDGSKAFSVELLALSNQPPIADAGPPSSVSTGTTVIFNGAASHDPDGSVASYSWSSSAFPAPLTGASPSFGFTTAGKYTVVLTVTDNLGATGTASVIVTVSNPSQMNGEGGAGGEGGAAGSSGDAGNTARAGSGGDAGNTADTTNAGSAGEESTPEAGQPSTSPSPSANHATGAGCSCTTTSGGSESGHSWLVALVATALLRRRRRGELATTSDCRRAG